MAPGKLPGMRHYCEMCGGWSVTETEVHDAECPEGRRFADRKNAIPVKIRRDRSPRAGKVSTR